MRSAARRAVLRAVIVMSLVWGGAANAADPAETPDAAFARGLASFEAGRTEEAIATWESLAEKLGEERAFRLLYNLGLAYEKIGDGARAIERFDGFLQRLAREPAELTRDLEERRQDAAERAKALKAARGAVVVPKSSAQNAKARVDGGAERETGFKIYLLPGEHTVELRFAAAESPRVERIRVEAGGEQTVDTSPPAPKPQVVVLRAPTPAPQMPVGVLVAGGALTVLSFGLPISLGLRAADLRAEAADLGRGHSGYGAALGRFTDARTAYETSYLLPGALGVATLVVAGISLERVLSTDAPPHASPGAAPRLGLRIGPGNITARGTW